IERLARSGCKLIFTTSFGFMDATFKVAAKFPDVNFEHGTGYKAGPNLATYNSRFYVGRPVILRGLGGDLAEDVAAFIE
ncbi:BMP family ABC transporter substrate-binding protein, partial [Rhizobium ruizarguesonis]